MNSSQSKDEFFSECCVLLAQVGIEASESMPISRRIMILTAIAALFPEGSTERLKAKSTAESLASAERCQLELTRFLEDANTLPNSPDTHL